MQVARNFFLTRDKTWTRKLYEVLLAYKIEDSLSKDEILELYINQIYLGQRAYGFQSASQVYFGKPLRDINAAEAAMLAGLPKAPSAYNPIVNPSRARVRQEYVLRRMNDLEYLDDAQFEEALNTELVYRNRKANGDDIEATTGLTINADYAAEMARQAVVEMYGEEAYTSGITVTTTLIAKEQRAAQRALRNSVMDYELRQFFRGPEGYIELPNDPKEAEEVIGDNISDYTDYGFLQSAVVLSASPTEVVVSQGAGEPLKLTGTSLKPAESWLNERAPANKRLKRGAVVRILKRKDQPPMLTQLLKWKLRLLPLTPKTVQSGPCPVGSSFLATNSTMSPRPPANRARHSSRLCILLHLKRESHQPHWWPMNPFLYRPTPRAARTGAQRTTTESTTVPCCSKKAWPNRKTWCPSACCKKLPHSTASAGPHSLAFLLPMCRPTSPWPWAPLQQTLFKWPAHLPYLPIRVTGSNPI